MIVVDDRGFLVADSDGPVPPKALYATSGRPEIQRRSRGHRSRRSATASISVTTSWRPPSRSRTRNSSLGAVRITQNVQQVNDNVRNVTLGLGAIGLAGARGRVAARVLARRIALPSAHAAGRRRQAPGARRPLGSRRRRERRPRGRGARAVVRRDGRPARALGPGAARVRRQRLAPAPNAADRDEAPARRRDRGGARRGRPPAPRGGRPRGRSPVRDRRSPPRHGSRDRGGDVGERRPGRGRRPRGHAMERARRRARFDRRLRGATAGRREATPPTSTRSSTTCSTTRSPTRRARSRSNPAARTDRCSSPCGTGDPGSHPTTSHGSPNASTGDEGCPRVVRVSGLAIARQLVEKWGGTLERGEHARRRDEGRGSPGRGAMTFTSP